jgi:leucyl-tRNA synthetase
VHDEALCLDDMLTVVIQVNGKKRDELRVPKDVDNATLERLALSSERVAKLLDGRAPRRVIVVAGRLVNIVV